MVRIVIYLIPSCSGQNRSLAGITLLNEAYMSQIQMVMEDVMSRRPSRSDLSINSIWSSLEAQQNRCMRLVFRTSSWMLIRRLRIRLRLLPLWSRLKRLCRPSEQLLPEQEVRCSSSWLRDLCRIRLVLKRIVSNWLPLRRVLRISWPAPCLRFGRWVSISFRGYESKSQPSTNGFPETFERMLSVQSSRVLLRTMIIWSSPLVPRVLFVMEVAIQSKWS